MEVFVHCRFLTSDRFEIDAIRIRCGIGALTVNTEIEFRVGLEKDPTMSMCANRDRLMTYREGVSKPSDLLLFEILAVVGPESPILIGTLQRNAFPNITATVRSSIATVSVGAPRILRDHHLLAGNHTFERVNLVCDRTPNCSGHQACAIVGHD